VAGWLLISIGQLHLLARLLFTLAASLLADSSVLCLLVNSLGSTIDCCGLPIPLLLLMAVSF